MIGLSNQERRNLNACVKSNTLQEVISLWVPSG